jgi:hypothetical protein
MTLDDLGSFDQDVDFGHVLMRAVAAGANRLDLVDGLEASMTLPKTQ